MNKKTMVMMQMALVFAAGTALADNINGVNIDFVNIGNAGNSADSTGYGAVGYNYQIGKYEVTISQFAAAYSLDSNISDNGNENVWSALGADAPAANVSWHEAARFCNFLTSSNAYLGAYSIDVNGEVSGINRAAAEATYGTVYVMPTEDEWYKAAYYGGSSVYSLYANGTGTAPVDETDAVYGRSVGSGPWTTVSGTAEQNDTFNMMGNMWEHTETLDGGSVAYHGGSYFQGVTPLQSTSRAFDSPDAEYTVVGFRVAAIPEPGVISLMSLSTIGLFFTRTLRRRKQAGKSLIPIGREHLCDTFCTFEEWDVGDGEMEGSEYIAELKQMATAQLIAAWEKVHACYKAMDRMLWSRMVVVHERRVERRRAFKKAFKRRALDSFDALLALIMK